MWAQVKLVVVALFAAVVGLLGGEWWRGQLLATQPTALPAISMPPPSPTSWGVAANNEGAWVVSREGAVYFCDRAQCTQIRN